ncbi:MAG: hypothetical protein AAF734_05405, partial [Bacteroidota bacterium]
LYRDEITDGAYKALSNFSSFDKVSSLDLHQTRPTIHEKGTYLGIKEARMLFYVPLPMMFYVCYLSALQNNVL